MKLMRIKNTLLVLLVLYLSLFVISSVKGSSEKDPDAPITGV